MIPPTVYSTKGANLLCTEERFIERYRRVWVCGVDVEVVKGKNHETS